MSCDGKKFILFPTNPIKIGKIGGVYGILGWMKIISFTDKIDNIFNYCPWFIFMRSKWKIIYLDQWRLFGKRYIIKIKGISDRESAKLLTHYILHVDAKQFPYLNDDEYYWKDLIGCSVITITNDFLGNVINIIETAANDVLIINLHKTDRAFRVQKDCLIPFLINKVIKNINLITRTIIVDWDRNF